MPGWGILNKEMKRVHMESNKDEAIRAKEIAKRKFIARDILGAREFALKAQNLFPDLEGIPQLLATIDVHFTALFTRNGEADWYGILGVTPQADDGTVRKQYSKLALMLHPDNNKSFGADEAFKLISMAWNLLSDKAKKVAYDEKIKAKAFKQDPRTQDGTAKEHVSTSANESKPKTFWTFCHRCQMLYEYLMVYLNRELFCHHCKAMFLAVQIAPPETDIRLAAAPWKFMQKQQRIYQLGERTFIVREITAVPIDPFSRTSGVSCWAQATNVVLIAHPKVNQKLGERSFIVKEITATTIDPFSRTSGVSSGAQAADVIQHAHQKVKREREEAQAAMKMEEEYLFRKLLYDVSKDFFFDYASCICKIFKTTATKVFSHAELQNVKEQDMETNHTDETAVEESGNESNDYQKVNVKEEDMVKVNSEDAIIEETADENMAEDNGEEMVSDIGKLGEDKERNNKDIQ